MELKYDNIMSQYSNHRMNSNLINKAVSKIVKVLQEKIIKKREKIWLIIEIIIRNRIKAITTIIKFFRKIKSLFNLKREYIKTTIIKERNEALLKLQKRIKFFLFKKEVNKLIEMEKDYFCIMYIENNVKKVNLNVLKEHKSSRVLEFTYCKIRKVFVLYISKVVAQGRTYKVHFIADKNVVIYPKFRSSYDEEGHFYNIIDFEKIEEEEIRLEKEKERVLKYYIDRITKQRKLEDYFYKVIVNDESKENSSSSDEEDNKEDRKTPIKENRSGLSSTGSLRMSYKRDTKGVRKSLQGSHLGLLSRSILNIKGQLKHISTHSHLMCQIKPILRSPYSSKNSKKKVSFGAVEFSL